MQLSIKGLALAGGLLWGASILLVGLLNLTWPTYGTAFLEVPRSIYPGYAATSGLVGVIVGTVYGVIDGGVAGALLGWLYNSFTSPGAVGAA
ncbi:MAG: hypothetical protein AABY85_01470 [Gemmatimonadota bacterium]|jgi:hypothetical protein